MVSVDYADYLECIAPNVRHFDRFLVITVESDTRTQEVCRRHGMEILFSRRLYEDGAAFHKAAALNEGLAALDQDAWVAVMDSDILLPHDFRERLDAQELDGQCLYGLAGRRVCPTLAEFRALASREPWTDNLIYTTFVIGYFNLFHLTQELNRYPENTSDDASTYDVVFSDRFPATRRRYLPFVCLHAGDTSQNWRGRTTDPFLETAGTPAEEPDATAEIAALLGGPDTHVVQIGCYRGEPGRTLAQHFARVTVIDHWGLTARVPAAALETDLSILRARYADETAGISNITPPLEHSAETLAGIPDGSLDALWLTPEPEYDFLLNSLPAWLPKLKPGGAITGGFYDAELLPGPARLVHLLFGVPDKTFAGRQWLRRLADPAGYLASLLPPVVSSSARGVVYLATSEEDVEPLLVSFSSLRRHWQGAVCVISAGDENPSLCLACARLGVEFRNVPASVLPELTMLRALEWSPFAESIFLDAATLVRAPLDWLFDALLAHDSVFCTGASNAVSTAVFAWCRRGGLPDLWCALAAAMLPFLGPKSVAAALASLARDGVIHVLPEARVWSGAVNRMPASTRLLALPRLARAGALHLYAPWAEEEQALLRLLQPLPG